MEYRLDVFRECIGYNDNYNNNCNYNYNYNDELWDVVNSHRFLFSSLPFVRDIAVCNSLSFGVADGESDIDLFIILDSKRFFLGRFFISIFFHMAGIRRHGRKISARFCLSFFVSEKRLDLSAVKLEFDPYLYFWFYHLIFLKGNIDVQNRLLRENTWFKEDGFKFKCKSKFKSNFLARSLEIVFGLFLFGLLEVLMKKIQMKRALKKRSQLKDNFGVVVEDGFLKFHNVDIRKDFAETYAKNFS